MLRADVRYLNQEWRGRDEVPEIGTRESRRSNTNKVEVEIHDGRDGDFSLDRNGFVLRGAEGFPGDYHDDAHVQGAYYPRVEDLIRAETGADEVFFTQHVVRTEDRSDFNKAYARFIHCDYRLRDPRDSAMELLKKRGVDVEAYRDAEFAWYNTWQPLDNDVEANPLAFIDATTLADDDIVEYCYTGFGNRDGRSSIPLWSPGHRFYYFRTMTPNEVLILKQLDTRSERATTTPHTSFDDPTTTLESKPRRSIEVRVMAVFGAN